MFLYKLMQVFREVFYQTNFKKSRDSESTVPLDTYSRKCCLVYLNTINRSSLNETNNYFCRWLGLSADKISNEGLDGPHTKWQQFAFLRIVNHQLPLQTDLLETKQSKQPKTEIGTELKVWLKIDTGTVLSMLSFLRFKYQYVSGHWHSLIQYLMFAKAQDCFRRQRECNHHRGGKQRSFFMWMGAALCYIFSGLKIRP